MRDIQVQLKADDKTFVPYYTIMIDGKPLLFSWTPDAITDLKAFHPSLNVEDEMIQILKATMSVELEDLHYNLTQEEVNKILELVKEKLK